VTRGQFPQRVGSPGLNGGGAAAAASPWGNWPPDLCPVVTGYTLLIIQQNT